MVASDLLKEIQQASISSIEIELKSYYLLGDTTEFDDFNPELVSLPLASPFEKYKYACCKYVGYKTRENEKEAKDMWEALSSEGEVNSMLEHSATLFAKKENEQAFKCLLGASKKGSITAIFRIALCYLNGLYVKKDEAKGLQLMKLLADKKYPDAVYFLSIMYAVGEGGLPFDEKKSEELLLQAVKLESKFALTEYGFRMFVTSNDVSEKEKAFKMIRDSADIGDPRAMTMLAVIYAKGEEGVVDESAEQSRVYLSLAHDLGYTPAINMVKVLMNNDADNN